MRDMSDREVHDFRRLYGTTDNGPLAERFRLTREEVALLARRLALGKNLRGQRRLVRWDEATLAKLRELYPGRSNLEVARELGRTVKSVVSKAHQLGLKKSPTRLEAMGRENVSRRPSRGA